MAVVVYFDADTFGSSHPEHKEQKKVESSTGVAYGRQSLNFDAYDATVAQLW